MDTYIKPIKDDERLAHGIALTRALKENIFAVIVGIECNIPATRLELFWRRRGVHTICVFFFILTLNWTFERLFFLCQDVYTLIIMNNLLNNLLLDNMYVLAERN